MRHRPIVPERLTDRFMAKVEVTDGCWLWKASVNNQGYGRFSVESRAQYAHRVAFVLFRGPVPDGLVIDHLCRVRRCVNPAHLRAVTQRENILAEGSLSDSRVRAMKTHCLRGHPFDAANTLVNKHGHRACRMCRDAARRLWTKARV